MDIKKVALALAALMVLVTLTSGCINANWVRSQINPDQGHIIYEINEKLVQKHFFETVVTDATTFISQESNPVNITDGTEWILVSIDVTLDDLGPIPIPIPDLPVDIQRYVQVVITMPNGVAWFNKTYNVTETEKIDIQGPIGGEWLFQVNAVGYGSTLVSYHDSYEIIVKANEPIIKD